jgi:hypothetical protein
MATSGMSPSALLCGSADDAAGTTVLAQAVVTIVNCFRHRPSWITTGMLFTLPAAVLLTGTFGRMNFPSAPVVTVTRGDPEAAAPHWSQDTFAPNGCTAEFGTYTSAPGIGRTPFGVVTVPLMLVVPAPHVVCCVQRPVHA